MTEEQEDKPKIIVDDDWKSRAQAEKELLQEEAKAKQSSDDDSAQAAQDDTSLPPASFAVLVTSLASQTLAMLGQIPNAEGKPTVQLDHAKHCIDMLGMLQEKTKGNLTAEELTMLANVLHELRMIYVAAEKNPPSPSGQSEESSA